MKKVIALRRPDRIHDGRYISKNNANIARLSVIQQMFPDAKVLLPVRHPLEQATSLLKQHKRFVELHKCDAFSQRYMQDIGHYEFGALHRPISFSGFDAFSVSLDTLSIDYWLKYWITAFEHILTHSKNVIIVSYEQTCMNGKQAIADICLQLDIPQASGLDSIASRLRPPPPLRGNRETCNRKLLDQAETIYHEIIRNHLFSNK